MKDRYSKRRKLQRLLFARTYCGIQYTGWSCNTCFHALELGVARERLHELWESTLLLRGDYKNGDYGLYQNDETLSANIDELISLLQQPA